MAWLGALAQLDLDHLYLRVARIGDEAFFAETTIVVAAAEVARADLPDQVAAMHAVVLRDRAFTRVVREVAGLGAFVEREDRVGRQRPEAHRRNVEHAGFVRLRAVGADHDAEVVVRDLGRHHRVVDPLVASDGHVELRTKRPVVGLALRALVHERALRARKRRRLGIALDEVLTHLGPDVFE